MRIRMMFRGGAVLSAGALALAACGGSYSASSQAKPAAKAAPAANAPPPAPAPAVQASVKATSVGGAQVLVSADGLTLYRFDKDTTNASNCSGGCAKLWPALTVSGTPVGSAALSGALGTITRADGTTQVTYQGHPLYHYAGDTKPGDTTGDGFGGIWHVVHPGAVAAATTPTTAAPSGGYTY